MAQRKARLSELQAQQQAAEEHANTMSEKERRQLQDKLVRIKKMSFI